MTTKVHVGVPDSELRTKARIQPPDIFIGATLRVDDRIFIVTEVDSSDDGACMEGARGQVEELGGARGTFSVCYDTGEVVVTIKARISTRPAGRGSELPLPNRGSDSLSADLWPFEDHPVDWDSGAPIGAFRVA